jgi:hypothetical protein
VAQNQFGTPQNETVLGLTTVGPIAKPFLEFVLRLARAKQKDGVGVTDARNHGVVILAEMVRIAFGKLVLRATLTG